MPRLPPVNQTPTDSIAARRVLAALPPLEGPLATRRWRLHLSVLAGVLVLYVGGLWVVQTFWWTLFPGQGGLVYILPPKKPPADTPEAAAAEKN